MGGSDRRKAPQLAALPALARHWLLREGDRLFWDPRIGLGSTYWRLRRRRCRPVLGASLLARKAPWGLLAKRASFWPPKAGLAAATQLVGALAPTKLRLNWALRADHALLRGLSFSKPRTGTPTAWARR